MDMKITTPKIWVLKHSTLTNDPCAICGGRCDPVGLDAGIEGSTALVCDPCCQEHAPAVWQGINAGRRFAEAEAKSAATVARLDAEAEHKPRPLPTPAAMARAMHAESRARGVKQAEWTDLEFNACDVVLAGEAAVRHGDDECLLAFDDLIQSRPIRMTHTEAVRIVTERYRRRIESMAEAERYRRRIEPAGPTNPWRMANELICADWAPGFMCSDEESAALAHVLAHERMSVDGSEWAADRLVCGERLAASEAVVESFHRRVFRPDEQPIAVEDLKWSREGEPLPWNRNKPPARDARPYWS